MIEKVGQAMMSASYRLLRLNRGDPIDRQPQHDRGRLFL